MGREGGIRKESWMGKPNGSFVLRNTIINVTTDLRGSLVTFMYTAGFWTPTHPRIQWAEHCKNAQMSMSKIYAGAYVWASDEQRWITIKVNPSADLRI